MMTTRYNRLTWLMLALLLLGACQSAPDPTLQPSLRLTSRSIEDVENETVPLLPDAANIETAADDSLVYETTITTYVTASSPEEAIEFYRRHAQSIKWKGYSSRPKQAPADSYIFGLTGQDGDTLRYRNIAVHTEPCNQQTCVFIVDERYTMSIPPGLN
jgi:hypothetical protein